MLRIILIVLAIIVVGFLIAAAFQPAEYRISRSALMSAPPAVVFANVNTREKKRANCPPHAPSFVVSLKPS